MVVGDGNVTAASFVPLLTLLLRLMFSVTLLMLLVLLSDAAAAVDDVGGDGDYLKL